MLTTPVTYDRRLRDLEAEAFRTARTLAEHSEQLATIREQQRTAFRNIESLGNAIGALTERTIAERLDTIEQRLGTIEHVLSALARTQDVSLSTVCVLPQTSARRLRARDAARAPLEGDDT